VSKGSIDNSAYCLTQKVQSTSSHPDHFSKSSHLSTGRVVFAPWSFRHQVPLVGGNYGAPPNRPCCNFESHNHFA